MVRTQKAAFIYLNPLFLVIWFFIWGICPWDNTLSAAQAGNPGAHGHSEATDPHHASKGTEHSCSGSISYSKSDLGSERCLSQTEPVGTTVVVPDRPIRLNDPSYFFELSFLPRLFTDYYQLYSIYRI
ncbi:MAG: hypothetical protein MPW14_16145 [Candidatus Manganitrophus sp.]|nr:hypothetical protein [Candidatus Manganitrophus sp.]MDC4227203.1 hypothetical protein [Candidatus Manganitrophus sp.]WDT69685.1 MAG: hypothetical protein MPW17_12950 [Candidatus Manganitrophus sp.]WDT78701.1 MAG: hypothetical protein MPW14_16145 [Candidatus Manganitrophus sp.]